MTDTPVNALMRRVQLANKLAQAAAKQAALAASREEYEIAAELFTIAARQMHKAYKELELEQVRL
jgi:hypothetical protein